MPKRKQFIRHNQPVLTRLNPHQGNSRYLKGGNAGGSGPTPPAGPAFHALTYDETTYEMLGVKTGTGGLTTTHADTLYAPDHEGVQRAFGADEPVWAGGRVVSNYAYSSENFTGVEWRTLGSTKVGATNIDGKDCMEVSLNAGATNALYQQSDYGQLPVGTKFIVTAEVRSKTGTIDLRISQDNAVFSPDISVGEAWTIISVAEVTDTASTKYPAIRNGSGGAAVDFYIHRFWLEVVDGQADTTTPGEYLLTTRTSEASPPTFKTFANLNGNTVLNNVVTEGVGAPLPEVPYLQYYPAATNSVIESVDLTSWTPTGTPIVTIDQVGLDGGPNNAARIEDDDAGARESVTSGTVTVPNDSSSTTAVVYIKKDTDQTRFPLIKLTLDGGTLTENRVRINTQTGALHSLDGGTQEAIDVGDWWKLVIQATNNASGNTAAYIRTWPADATVLDGAAGNTAVGAIITGNNEIHIGKTIAEVRGLGPVFTTTAAVSVARTAYSFDALNHAETGAYYFENVKNGNGAILDAFLEVISPNYQLEDGAVVVTQGWTENTSEKVGAVFEAGNQMVLNVDGVYGTDGVFNGTLLGIPFDLYRGGLYGDRIRNLQRYDITSYAEGKTIIDGLMT